MIGLGERLDGVDSGLARMTQLLAKLSLRPLERDVVRCAFTVRWHDGLLMTDGEGVVCGVADEQARERPQRRSRTWSQTTRVRMEGVGLHEMVITAAWPRRERFATVENSQGVVIAGLHEPPRVRGLDRALGAVLADRSIIESRPEMRTQWLPWPRLHFDQHWYRGSTTVAASVTVEASRYSDPCVVWGVRFPVSSQVLERAVVLAMLTCGQRIDWTGE